MISKSLSECDMIYCLESYYTDIDFISKIFCVMILSSTVYNCVSQGIKLDPETEILADSDSDTIHKCY